MKILHISLSLGGGGAERIAVSLCNRFAAKEDDEVVLVSVLDDADPSNVFYLKDLSPRVRHVNLHCHTGLQMKAFWRVYQTIRQERPDVVHTHFSAVLLLFPALLIPQVHYFHTIHNLAKRIEEKSGFLKRSVMCYLFTRNRVKPVTISEACRRSYRETYHVHNDICITNGSEPLTLTPDAQAVKSEIDTLKGSPSDIVFIHVARHHSQKNHGRLFRTFLRLEKEGERFILIVLGDHYDSCLAELKDSKCIFLLGPKSNVGDYMKQADFFVLSSDYEGLPMTMLEAMSMGVVPISTPAGGVVDVIEDGVTGYLTDSFDDEEFYRRVRHAISEKGLIPSERIRQHYEQHFSMETCAAKYYEAYKTALTR